MSTKETLLRNVSLRQPWLLLFDISAALATVDRICSRLLLHGKKRLDLFHEPAESIAGREQWLRLWQHMTRDELYTREC
jgi:hypothetical protein